jgi:uncharacterized protein YqhQ
MDNNNIKGFNYDSQHTEENIRGFKSNETTNYPQNNPTLARDITLSILNMLFVNLVTGIFSLVFTIIANDRFKQGNYFEYEDYTKNARLARIIGLVSLGLIILIFVIFIVWILSILTAIGGA